MCMVEDEALSIALRHCRHPTSVATGPIPPREITEACEVAECGAQTGSNGSGGAHRHLQTFAITPVSFVPAVSSEDKIVLAQCPQSIHLVLVREALGVIVYFLNLLDQHIEPFQRQKRWIAFDQASRNLLPGVHWASPVSKSSRSTAL